MTKSITIGTQKAPAKDRYGESGEELVAPGFCRTVLSDLLRHHIVG
jgi:hypothetical protein